MKLLILAILLTSSVARADRADDGDMLLDIGIGATLQSSDIVLGHDANPAGWQAALAVSINIGPWKMNNLAVIAHIGATTPRLAYGVAIDYPGPDDPDGGLFKTPAHYVATELGLGVEANLDDITVAPWIGIDRLIAFGEGADDIDSRVSPAIGLQVGEELYADSDGNHVGLYAKLTYAPIVGRDYNDNAISYTQVGIGLNYRYF